MVSSDRYLNCLRSRWVTKPQNIITYCIKWLLIFLFSYTNSLLHYGYLNLISSLFVWETHDATILLRFWLINLPRLIDTGAGRRVSSNLGVNQNRLHDGQEIEVGNFRRSSHFAGDTFFFLIGQMFTPSKFKRPTGLIKWVRKIISHIL